jgi:predicted RecB family nuclease
MAERLLTPSKITAWLECAHFLTLRHEVDSGVREPSPNMFNEMADMLLQKGLDHEKAIHEQYLALGREVFDVPERQQRESFAQWVARVGDVLGAGHDVIFQMPFVHDGIRGVADFLERVVDVDGNVTYEPVDAKLARNAAKPGHVLQLCFYAEAIAALTGRLPERVHIELGSGDRETIRVDDVLAYWRRLRGRLAALVAELPTEPTTPKPCDHCGFCEFEQVCDAEWRENDSLVYVAGVRRTDRASLQDDGVHTIAALAALDREVAELDAGRVTRMVRQASLQVQARNASESDPPPFELLNEPAQATADPSELDVEPIEPELTGFAALPAPDRQPAHTVREGVPLFAWGRTFGWPGGVGDSRRPRTGCHPSMTTPGWSSTGGWSWRPTSGWTRIRRGGRPGALSTYSRGSRRTRAPVVVSATMAPAASWPSSWSMHTTRSPTSSVGR